MWGLIKKLQNVSHHNLFFDTNFEQHAIEIYDDPKWARSSSLLCQFSSITDSSMAPEGCETGFFLVPIAPNLRR